MMLMCLPALLQFDSTASRAKPETVNSQHIRHGLRVFIDPDTGRFGRPDDLPLTALASIHTATKATSMVPLPAEQASARAGGGYTVNMTPLYRPVRTRPLGRKAGS